MALQTMTATDPLLECARFLSTLSARPLSPQPPACSSGSEPNKGSISWLLNGGPRHAEGASCPAARAQAAFISLAPPHGSPAKSADFGLVLPAAHHAGLAPSSAPALAPLAAPAVFALPPVSVPMGVSRKRALDIVPPSPALSDALASASSTPVASHDCGSERSSTASPCASSNVDGSEDGDRRLQTIALDTTTALDIYQKRPRDAGTKYGSMACAAQLAAMYDVSPKTIRDIWNRKSWVKATKPMWTAEEKRNHVPRSHRSREDDKGERRSKSRRLNA